VEEEDEDSLEKKAKEAALETVERASGNGKGS